MKSDLFESSTKMETENIVFGISDTFPYVERKAQI